MNLDIYKKLVQLKTESLHKTMDIFLRKNYDTVVTTNDYTIAIGDIPIALVAHMDTVFPFPPTRVYFDMLQNTMIAPFGMGADDRAGVYAIVTLIHKGYRPHIIFTTDEEKGAKGAIALTKDFPIPFANMKYIIELDRRGKCDCVFYDCDNPEFTKYVSGFGFTEAIGSFTDISILCEAWKVAGVNLSVGYFNEHTASEILRTDFLDATILKVESMLRQADTSPSFEFIQRNYESYMRKCHHCGKSFLDFQMFPAKLGDERMVFVCPDCICDDKKIRWCVDCGEPFIPYTKDETRCKECENDELGRNKN